MLALFVLLTSQGVVIFHSLMPILTLLPFTNASKGRMDDGAARCGAHCVRSARLTAIRALNG